MTTTINVDQIIYNHHYYNKSIKNVLIIVENYIKQNNLILVGGMAIDLALRTKGSNIYDDNELPDYDVISHLNLKHAQDLGHILCMQGYENIRVVPAVHVTTVRIKYKDVTVFDATYVPEIIINKIPILESKGFNVIHPHYQKIDQYSSMSLLMEKTGISANIFHRLKKDVIRNELLCTNFPFELINKPIIMDTIEVNTELIGLDQKLQIYELMEDKLNLTTSNKLEYKENQYFESNNLICNHGFISYALLNYKFNELCNKHNIKHNNEFIINSNTKIITKNKHSYLSFNIPINETISLLSTNNENEKLIKKIKLFYTIDQETKFNKLLGLKPITTLLNTAEYDIELYDMFGIMLSINYIEINNISFITANYNYLLAFYLYKYYLISDTNTDYYLQYYNSILQMILVLKENNIVDPLFDYSINTYGSYNIHDSHYYYLENFDYISTNHRNSTLKPLSSNPVLPNCKAERSFDLSSSHYFDINCEKNNNIKHTNNSYLLPLNNRI